MNLSLRWEIEIPRLSGRPFPRKILSQKDPNPGSENEKIWSAKRVRSLWWPAPGAGALSGARPLLKDWGRDRSVGGRAESPGRGGGADPGGPAQEGAGRVRAPPNRVRAVCPGALRNVGSRHRFEQRNLTNNQALKG